MAARQPLIVVLAGPNGAGKSTAAPSLLRDALVVEEFVNADTIAHGLSEFQPEQAAVAAGRIMLARLDTLARQRASFAFETTLASRSFAPWLRARQSEGYHVHIAFLSLPDAEIALARVRERVRLGGHNVPEELVRRRYVAGLRNFFGIYHGLPDSWQMLDSNAPGGPRLIASKQAVDTDVVIVDGRRWRSLMEQAR